MNRGQKERLVEVLVKSLFIFVVPGVVVYVRRLGDDGLPWAFEYLAIFGFVNLLVYVPIFGLFKLLEMCFLYVRDGEQ